MRKVQHYCFFLGFFVFLLAGCTSTGVTDTAVLDHQRQLGEYQGAVEGFIRRADECATEIDRIRSRADGLGEQIDRVIEEFDNYQQAVERFLREYHRLKNEIENLDKNLGIISRSTITNDIAENSGLYPVLQGNSYSPMAGYIALRRNKK